MAKKQSAGRRKNINFRQTHSERSATQSYRNFAKFFKGKLWRTLKEE